MPPKYGYVTYVFRELPSSGYRSSQLFSATATLPGFSRQAPVWLRVPDIEAQKKIILHELLGSRICRLLQIPAPETYVCACEKRLLPSGARCLDSRDPKSTHVKSLANVDGNPQQLKQRMLLDLAKVDRLAWRFLPELAVFDELVAIGERQSVDLYRTGQHEYMLLDNVLMFGGPDWELENLEQRLIDLSGENSVADLIAASTYDIPKHRMLAVARNAAETLRFDHHSLGDDLALYTLLTEQEIAAVLNLLTRRLKNLEAALRGYLERDALIPHDSDR